MRRRKYTKKKSVPLKLSKKYKTLDQNQINELIQNTQSLFECLDSIKEASEKYKIFQSAISLVILNNEKK